MVDADDRQHRRATGSRRLESALLDAAWEELQTSGYAKLTTERIAERAGTSRAVIYRRWQSRPELVIAALRHHQPVVPGRVPDTGTLRGDMLAVLSRVSSRLSAIGPDTVVGLLGDLLADKEALDYVHEQLLRGGTEVMMAVLERAAARGEARSEVSPRVARVPLDLICHELILNPHPPSQQTIEEIVDEVFLPLVLPTR